MNMKVPLFLLPQRMRRSAERELDLDVRLAARAMARQRHAKGREPFRKTARQICAELGVPVPAALEESHN